MKIDITTGALIVGAAAIGFLFFTEPGKNILRSFEQQYYSTQILPGLDPARQAEVMARKQETGYY